MHLKGMMSVVEKIREAREKGNLAVGAYTILGYPDLSTSQRALEVLRKSGIAIFETAFPLAQKYSPELSNVIINAHRMAHLKGVTQEAVLSVYGNFRPNLYIIHEGTMFSSFEGLLKEMGGLVDGVMLGWIDDHIEGYYQACESRGINMVQLVSPSMRRKEIAGTLKYAKKLVYLTVSPKTGGVLYPRNTIARTIKRVKSIRDDISICCGFGIRNPDDIKAIGSLDGCDGVIIGSAMLEVLAKGMEQFERYVRVIMSAAAGLKRTLNR